MTCSIILDSLCNQNEKQTEITPVQKFNLQDETVVCNLQLNHSSPIQTATYCF